MGSQYNENIGKALDIYFNKKLSTLGYDQTIIAEIYEIIDAEKGKYKIKYESAIFNAEAIDVSKKYKVGYSVYIKVPKGDFSEKLLIESIVDQEATLRGAELKYMSNFYIPISPGIELKHNFQLVAGDFEQNPQEVTKEVFESYDSIIELQFREQAKQYEVLKLEAFFSNSFISIHNTGNYGLKFNFLTSEQTEGNNIKTFTLDTADFIGNYYAKDLKESHQYKYVKVKKGELVALKSITFFQENFEQDINVKLKENNLVTDFNLFAANPKVTFYEITDLTKEEKHLQLLAPRGYYGEDLIFKAILLEEGKEVLDSDYSFFWYENKILEMLNLLYQEEEALKEANTEEEKNQIKTHYQKQIEKYTNTLLGEGWKALNETSASEITITPNEETNIKLVVYNQKEEEVAEYSFTIGKYELNNKPSIIQTEGDGYILLETPENYIARFQYNGKDIQGKSVKIFDYEFTQAIMSVKVYFILENEKEYSDFIELNISVPSKKDEIKAYFSGKEIYCYDTTGKIKIEQANTEKILSIGLGTLEEDVNAKIYLGDFEITEKPEDWNNYENTNSLLKNVYYTIEKAGNWNIHYSLEAYYDSLKDNNIFHFVFSNKNISKEFLKEIKFVKIGDMGCNGGNYILDITSQNLIFNPKSEKDFILDINVYNQGKRLQHNGDQQYKISKLILNRNEEEIDYSDKVTYYQQLIIKKEDVATNTGDLNYITLTIQTEEGYLTYKFGVPYGTKSLDDNALPPKSVRYNSDGQNPEYKAGKDFILNKEDKIFDFSKNKYYYFKNYEYNNNYFPIIFYLNVNGNAALNSWNNNAVLNNQYDSILAKQIISGNKTFDLEGNLQFSGIITGEIKDDTYKTKGIYGYRNNFNTFGIDINGNAFISNDGINFKLDNENIKIYNKEKIILNLTKNQEVIISSMNKLKFNDKEENLYDIIAAIQNEINQLNNKNAELEKIVSNLEERIAVLEAQK